MAEETATNSYEEVRKKQLLENKKRFEELGILKISRNLSELSKVEKKSMQRKVKPKIRNAEIVEPRRSTRARNPISTYQDESYVAWKRVPGRGRGMRWVLRNANIPKFIKMRTPHLQKENDMSDVEEEAETKKASMARKKRKTTVDSPGENETTPLAKSNSQAEKNKAVEGENRNCKK